MIIVHLPDGNSLTGAAETIVQLMRDSHWTVGDESIQAYMDRVQEDAKRLQGVEISTETPVAFLASLAAHKMIEIEEAA